jgi:hypothetical protein
MIFSIQAARTIPSPVRPHWRNALAAIVKGFTAGTQIRHLVMAITGSMTALILKRAKFSRPDGQWSDEDYDVLADGKVVGRILEEGSRFGPPELRWGWSLFIVPARRGVINGTAATREEAMAKFRAAWEKALEHPPS